MFASTTAIHADELPNKEVIKIADIMTDDILPLTDFDIHPKIQQQMEKYGIDKLFPVQAKSFEISMSGRDLMGRR